MELCAGGPIRTCDRGSFASYGVQINHFEYSQIFYRARRGHQQLDYCNVIKTIDFTYRYNVIFAPSWVQINKLSTRFFHHRRNSTLGHHLGFE